MANHALHIQHKVKVLGFIALAAFCDVMADDMPTMMKVEVLMEELQRFRSNLEVGLDAGFEGAGQEAFEQEAGEILAEIDRQMEEDLKDAMVCECPFHAETREYARQQNPQAHAKLMQKYGGDAAAAEALLREVNLNREVQEGEKEG